MLTQHFVVMKPLSIGTISITFSLTYLINILKQLKKFKPLFVFRRVVTYTDVQDTHCDIFYLHKEAPQIFCVWVCLRHESVKESGCQRHYQKGIHITAFHIQGRMC
jgi:hypothetical protein